MLPAIHNSVEEVLEDFLKECRNKIIDRNKVKIIIDAGWSHPGWWANECTVIALDASTMLPIAVQHIIRGDNYEGSSKGMEGYGAELIAKKLKTLGISIKTVLHDKDASTFYNICSVFEDVSEELCAGSKAQYRFCFLIMYFFNRTWLQKFKEKVQEDC